MSPRASLAAAEGSRGRRPSSAAHPSPSESGVFEYHLTEGGPRASSPWWKAFGVWGQRWVECPSFHSSISTCRCSCGTCARNLDPTPMPKRRRRDPFFNIRSCRRRSDHGGCWWARTPRSIFAQWIPDSMSTFTSSTDLRTMTAIWMGLDDVRTAQSTRRMMLTGDRRLAADMQAWLGLSPFAKVRQSSRSLRRQAQGFGLTPAPSRGLR